MNYNNKRFRPFSSSSNSEISSETFFLYKQNNNILTCNYKGGNIIEGQLIGLVDAKGNIDMRYHQVNTKGKLMTGVCTSKPEILANGKIRLHESWKWTCEDQSEGTSILEEI